MSDEQSIRDEIERAFNEWWNAPHPDDGSDLDFSEYIMPLIRRIRAEALREAVDDFEGGAVEHEDLKSRTEQAPLGWTDESIAAAFDASGPVADWLKGRADRIERGETA